MKELFREADYTVVGYFCSILDAEGIQTHIRNEALQGAGLSEIPIPEFYPALCVVNDEDFPKAIEIIRDHAASPDQPSEEDILCKNCGEECPGNFACCWNCEAPLKGDEA